MAVDEHRLAKIFFAVSTELLAEFPAKFVKMYTFYNCFLRKLKFQAAFGHSKVKLASLARFHLISSLSFLLRFILDFGLLLDVLEPVDFKLTD